MSGELDRTLAISSHAISRMKLRCKCDRLHPEYLRSVIRKAYDEALHGGRMVDHYRPGQQRFLVKLAGNEVWAVVGSDSTGWSTGGRAIITILTPRQVARSAEFRSKPYEASDPTVARP